MKNFFGNKFARDLVLFFAFTLLLSFASCSFQNRILLQQNTISVIYEHQLDGKNYGFQQTVNTSVFSSIKPESCSTDINNFYCIHWGNIGKFTITKKGDGCEDFQYTTTLEKPIQVTFDISNIHLYGGAQQWFQPWPAETFELENFSFVSKEENGQALLESYWLTSSGMYLYVSEETPLFITQSSRKKVLVLIAERRDPYIKPGGSTDLKYTVCKKHCMKSAHKHAIQNVLGKPKGIPDEKMVRDPIWSTWAKYKKDINEKNVLEFASKIVENKLPNSQIEIDDNWETCYGSLAVDRYKFPDMKQLVQKLKSMGFRVTIWVHPFVNRNCFPTINDGIRENYFIKNKIGQIDCNWWDGPAAHIDFTNPKAVEWYTGRLRKLLAETGIDSFKFDAGETSYTPQVPVLHQMKPDHPDTSLRSYIDTVSKFGGMIEVRTGRRTQEYPIFVRMNDRNTNWDQKLGFQTIVPALLHMNLVGYPFVLPDMVGGNGYGETEIVTDEMFIRWVQINAFMPAIQFSYPPWEYSAKVLEITKTYVQLHQQYADKIIALMKESVTNGTPVNPPIWWIAPHDPVTYDIDDEFLLGEGLLVAPIVKKGAFSRDVYLPEGTWKDEINPNKPYIHGPIWLYNYEVPLEKLAYFTKVNDEDNHHHHDDGDDNKSGARIVVPSLVAAGLSILITTKLFLPSLLALTN